MPATRCELSASIVSIFGGSRKRIIRCASEILVLISFVQTIVLCQHQSALAEGSRALPQPQIDHVKAAPLFLSNEILAFSQALDFQLLARCTLPDISNIVCRRLEMTGGIVTPGNIHIVLLSALDWLEQRNRWAHEAFFNLTESLEARLQLEMVVGITFGDGADDGDVVAVRADVVCGRHDSNIDIWTQRSVKR